MTFTNYDEIFALAKSEPIKKRMAVACAAEKNVLTAVSKAYVDGIAIPILTGQKKDIERLALELRLELPEQSIIDVDDKESACFEAVRLVREGKADFLMKGLVDTSVILKALLNKETGLSTGRLISHISILQIPAYHKLMAISDAAVNISPTLEQKKDIVTNGVEALRAMGYIRPKVAVLSAVEVVNPKMQDTLDAAALKQLALDGYFGSCDLEGPISIDLAINPEAVAIKGYESPVAGDADLVLVPNLVSGNLLSKSIQIFGGAITAAVVLGAKVPMVLTSRGASVITKYTSIAAASRIASPVGNAS